MAEVVNRGPGSYIYATTRMRVRKIKLVPREDYLRMLNMSLPEITRFIEETQYKAEIDELSSSFSGIDLLVVALSWNLAKEYQKVLDITPGILKEFTQNYLRRWDIQNVLNILRGKTQGLSSGKIKAVLIPAGGLDKDMLDSLLNEDSPERVVDALKGTGFSSLLEEEFPAAQESGSFARLENELYKQYFADIITAAKSGVKGGAAFLEYIRFEIDIRNIQTLFRLKTGRVSDVRDMMIEGGSFTVEELQRLAGTESIDDLIDAVKSRVRVAALDALLNEVRENMSVHEIENRLTCVMLEQMEKLSKRHPFSICPILVYLKKKRYEVENLRALARGKESNILSERIQDYLVM